MNPFSPQRRRFCRSKRLLLCIILSSLLAAQSAPMSYADTVWDRWKAADAAVAAGKPAEAVKHWKFLVDHYASAGHWENAALFSGRLNEYFDRTKDYEQAIHYYKVENEYWLKLGKDWGAVDIMRAEQISTTLEAYLEVSGKSASSQHLPASGKLAKFEPEYGMYIGMYSERDPEMLNYYTRSESIYGKNHAIYLAYAQWGKPFPKQYAFRAKEAGAALQVAWEPTNGLAEVADGSYLRQWAKDAKDAGIPIFLRFASEMNGNWTNWYGDPEAYIRAFRLVHDVLAKEAPNVAMVWSPNDVPKFSMSPYYPGDDYVDWVGVSLYTEPYENGYGEPMLATSPVERLDEVYKLYADRKPIMISETAVSHYANFKQEDVSDWALMNLQRLLEIMPKKYPRLKAITYFNVNMKDTESGNNYLLRDNEKMMSAYRKIISDPYYLSKVEQGIAPSNQMTYSRIEGTGGFAKKARVVPFVKIPDIHIGRVEYELNGRTLAVQRTAPYGVQLDADQAYEGSQLEIRVYNTSGQKVASKVFRIGSQVSVSIDGRDQHFEQMPVIVDGSTLTPLRAIFEAMGAKVTWDAKTMSARGTKGGKTVELTIGSRVAMVNGKPVELEQPAALINGFTMAPARFIGEAFDGRVEWEGKTRTVQIRTGR
jgi:hypothetical protein